MAGHTFRLTSAALADLEDIRSYTIDTWGRDQWLRYFAGLETVFARLQEEPTTGRGVPRLAPGVRVVVYRSHRVFFHENRREEVVVLRVLHQKRDIEAIRWAEMMGGESQLPVGATTHPARYKAFDVKYQSTGLSEPAGSSRAWRIWFDISDLQISSFGVQV